MVALTLAGLLFTWWARIHLGRLWSSDVARKADHHVVDTGPYGIVRHPIYTGILVASTATAAVRATPGAWLGAGLMTLGWVSRRAWKRRSCANNSAPSSPPATRAGFRCWCPSCRETARHDRTRSSAPDFSRRRGVDFEGWHAFW
jgi:hypothetical protein